MLHQRRRRRTPGRRSTTASPAQLRLARRPRARRPTRASQPVLRLRTRTAPRPAARSPAARSTTRRRAHVPGRVRRQLLLRRLLRRLDPARSTRRPGQSTASRPGCPRAGRPRRRPPTAASTTSRAATARQRRAAFADTGSAGAGDHAPTRRASDGVRRPAARRSRVSATGTAPLATSGSATAPNIPARPSSATRSPSAHARRQRRAVPRASSPTRRHRDEQRRDADRHRQPAARPRRSPPPPPATLYSGGDTITFAGTRDRPRGRHARRRALHLAGRLPPRRRTRTRSCADERHARAARSRSRRTGETAANVWYRIHLTVTDSGGLDAHRRSATCSPRTAHGHAGDEPAGLRSELDGQPRHRRRSPSPAWSAMSRTSRRRRRRRSTATLRLRLAGPTAGRRRTRSPRRRATRPTRRATATSGRAVSGGDVGAAAGRGARAGPGALAPRHPRAGVGPGGHAASGDVASRRAPAGRAAGDGRRRRRPAGPPARPPAGDPGAGRGVRDRA